MLGAIAGDIIGSVYEWNNIKTTDFPLFVEECRFTDDTVLTVAIADSILTGSDYAIKLKEYYRLYPKAGYGASFEKWAGSETLEPYNSWGNGSAMRVSPLGFACHSLEEVLKLARKSAEVTHNHPEGVKGAQAVAAAVFLARTGSSLPEIKSFVEQNFDYNLDQSIDRIRAGYKYDVSCQGSVPQAISAFLQSTGYEDAVRTAVSLGGDSDTIACITGSIAQAFYGIPADVAEKAQGYLDSRLNKVVSLFNKTFGITISSPL